MMPSMGAILISFLSTLSLRRATGWLTALNHLLRFLSTLSLRRATYDTSSLMQCQAKFLSTLSLRRATTHGNTSFIQTKFLSTLSLRRATTHGNTSFIQTKFLSTLSLRRATAQGFSALHHIFISIHALLAESDLPINVMSVSAVQISIHALLAESDARGEHHANSQQEFLSTLSLRRATKSDTATAFPLSFLSTLSLRRATPSSTRRLTNLMISIHALLAESDDRNISLFDIA